MSYSFRERLKIALREKELKEKLRLTQEEVDYIKEHLMDICPYSDKVTQAYKESISSGKSLDQIIDEMTDDQFEDLCREVFEQAKKNDVWAKKKKKKVEAEAEAEAEAESDTDSDSDSDAESVDAEAEEQEVECQEK